MKKFLGITLVLFLICSVAFAGTQDFKGTVEGVTINSTTIGPFTKTAAGEVTVKQGVFTANSTTRNTYNLSTYLYLEIADTVRIEVLNGGAGNLTIIGPDSFFEVIRIP